MENEETKVTENSECLVETIQKLQAELDEVKSLNKRLTTQHEEFGEAFVKLIDLESIVEKHVDMALFDIDIDDKVEDKLIDLLRDVRLEIWQFY